MARPWSGRLTCEMCQWVDVRCWHREGLLHPGRSFPCSWALGGKPYGSIHDRMLIRKK